MSSIELSPFTFPHSPSRVFTGSKHTSLMTIDLRTGQQLDCFSTLSENNTQTCVCETDRLLDDMEGHARQNSDILFVGRTDYRLVIHSPPSSSVYAASTGAAHISGRSAGLQEISYSTYTPNNFDKPIAEHWLKASRALEDSEDASTTRIELGHDGIAVGVAHGGGVKWMKDLGSIGIGVYDILLPMAPSSAKPIIVPQPPPRLESLFPLPANPDKAQYDIHAKSPTTYIGSVPYQLTISANDSDQTRPPASGVSEKPLLFALSSSSYPLINFAPQAKPGSQANGSFPLSEELPTKDQLLPYLLDPADEEKTIDAAPETIMQGLRRKEAVGRSWIFWVIGVLAALVMAGMATFALSQRKSVKQTETPPNEKEPLLLNAFNPASPRPVRVKLPDAQALSPDAKLEGDALSPEPKAKKKNNRRRVRGKKKQTGSVSEDDEDSITGSPKPKSDKPLPELPRAISTTAIEDESDKERLIISDQVIGMFIFAFASRFQADRQVMALTARPC
jgi:serine/threonine-protein kinase/endoribonuclease IRE1